MIYIDNGKINQELNFEIQINLTAFKDNLFHVLSLLSSHTQCHMRLMLTLIALSHSQKSV